MIEFYLQTKQALFLFARSLSLLVFLFYVDMQET